MSIAAFADSSALVKPYADEPGADAIRQFVAYDKGLLEAAAAEGLSE